MEVDEEEEKKKVLKSKLLIAKRASTSCSAFTRLSCTSVNTDSDQASRLDGCNDVLGQNSVGFCHTILLWFMVESRESQVVFGIKTAKDFCKLQIRCLLKFPAWLQSLLTGVKHAKRKNLFSYFG